MRRKERYACIMDHFRKEMPHVTTELEFGSVFQLLVATMLSAQCTDKRINLVTPALFARYPDAAAMAEADAEDIFEYIRSVSYPNAKSKHLAGMARMLVSEFNGEVPEAMADLVKLPGVGRKTANLMLGDVFHVPGVVVADTHCIRITGLLGLTDGSKDPTKVEMQLRKVLPPEESNDFCHRLVLHGRAVCIARRPQCGECVLRPWCDYFTKNVAEPVKD